MSYYWFNRKEMLQKAKENYSKEKAAEYYSQNKKQQRKNQGINTKTCQKKKNTSTKKKLYKINMFCFYSIIRTSEKTLKFDNIRVTKKEF